MTDRSNQIIPDSEAVVRCLDREILEILDSHGTFTINELSQRIDPSTDSSIDLSLEKLLSNEKINIIFDEINPSNCDFLKIIKDINEAIKPLVLSVSTDQLDLTALPDVMPYTN